MSAAARIKQLLKRSIPLCAVERVVSRDQLETALKDGNFDLVLAQDTLPELDGLMVLELVRKVCPEKPVIILAKSVGEERAVELLHGGAQDFVLKHNPGRLITAIRRALNRRDESNRNLQLEMALREARSLISEQATLLDKSQDAIMVQNLEGTITYWNQGAEQVYGWSSNEVIGRNGLTLLGIKSQRCRFAREHTMTHGEWHGELRHRTKHGREVVVQSRWSLVGNGQDSPKTFLVVNTDVTETRLLESKFLQAQRMESMGMMVGGIAHDLNNMLAPILMSVDILKQIVKTPGAEELIGTMHRSAKHGAALIQQLLAFARGAEGEHVEVELEPMLTEFVGFMEQTLEGDVELELSFNKPPPRVRVDVTQIKQVLMNLCINARDAMASQGIISINVDALEIDDAQAQVLADGHVGSFVVISVADTGEGISSQVMERIFDPFFTTKDSNRGTGLGLATVRGIVKGHGGFMSVESEPDKGTTFKVYLPVDAGEETETVESSPFAPSILLVDDEEMVRNTLSLLLKADGYQVYAVEDGVEALKVLMEKGDEIKLMISDLRMSGMDGCELITAVRQRDMNLPIIALTGNPVVDERETLERMGARLLAKPMTRSILLQSVKEGLEAIED